MEVLYPVDEEALRAAAQHDTSLRNCPAAAWVAELDPRTRGADEYGVVMRALFTCQAATGHFHPLIPTRRDDRVAAEVRVD